MQRRAQRTSPHPPPGAERLDEQLSQGRDVTETTTSRPSPAAGPAQHSQSCRAHGVPVLARMCPGKQQMPNSAVWRGQHSLASFGPRRLRRPALLYTVFRRRPAVSFGWLALAVWSLRRRAPIEAGRARWHLAKLGDNRAPGPGSVEFNINWPN